MPYFHSYLALPSHSRRHLGPPLPQAQPRHPPAEDVADAVKPRHEFVSGFAGSVALALITKNEALLWIDGRFFSLAEQEFSDQWKLMCIGKGLAVDPWMADVKFCSACVSYASAAYRHRPSLAATVDRRRLPPSTAADCRRKVLSQYPVTENRRLLLSLPRCCLPSSDRRSLPQAYRSVRWLISYLFQLQKIWWEVLQLNCYLSSFVHCLKVKMITASSVSQGTIGIAVENSAMVASRGRGRSSRGTRGILRNGKAESIAMVSSVRNKLIIVLLIGVSVADLEPEFQPLLQDMTSRLLIFLPQLETDLSSFPDSPESNLRFLAMLAGPLYPILHVVNESITDLDVSKSSQLSPTLTVSSNFELHSPTLYCSGLGFPFLDFHRISLSVPY
ncbi:Xaa-Pro aminopeptidase app-1, partial [Mucuna pruriens]